jgi:uncharacterized membrane protein YkvI
MKKLVPYILSYLIITAGVSVYSHYAGRPHHSLYPPNSVTVITTLSHDELAAKLQQVGVPEIPPLRTMTVRPAPLVSLVLHFLIFAVYFGAFVGLTHLFQRMFRSDVPSPDHAVS